MKKKFLSAFLIVCILLTNAVCMSFAAEEGEIVILYENDVHCNVDGYAKLAALKAEIAESADYVGVVSSGDFVQGSSLGVVSKGEYMVNLMNIVGYDAVTLGNHEFDYKIGRLFELSKMLKAPIVCSNFVKIDNEEAVFEPYTMVSYGDTSVAYIGVTTPQTLINSSPAQFKNEEGDYIYDFSGNRLCETVQRSIDSAKEKGADYIIALAHLGTESVNEEWSAQTLAKNTDGLDVILDGHSHSVVECLNVEDKSGKPVVISSTGTKFANIGKLTIKDGELKTELVDTGSYEKTDDEVSEYIEKINEEYMKLGNRKIGTSDVELICDDPDGNRLIRTTETNLGDLCADAYRIVNETDVGMINGGGIRANIGVGDITFNDILSVFPYNNKTCVAKVTGQQISDMLEFAMGAYPEETGAFQHVSGMTFDFDPKVESIVKVGDNNEFVSVEGARRVTNIKVLDKEAGEYLPIDLNEKYTLASHTYMLEEYGDGATMFEGAEIISSGNSIDVELLETYITENLGGKISAEYAESEGRINMLTEYVPLRKNFEEKGCNVIWTPDKPMTIVVESGNCTIVFTALSNAVTVNGKSVTADRCTYIEDGVTYISADCLALCE